MITYHFPSLFLIIGIGSAAMLPKFPKLDTDAALYKFSMYTLSVELNRLFASLEGINTTGMLSRLESVNFGAKSNCEPLESMRSFKYKFSTDLALSALLGPVLLKSNFSFASSVTAGVGGITEKLELYWIWPV